MHAEVLGRADLHGGINGLDAEAEAKSIEGVSREHGPAESTLCEVRRPR